MLHLSYMYHDLYSYLLNRHLSTLLKSRISLHLTYIATCVLGLILSVSGTSWSAVVLRSWFAIMNNSNPRFAVFLITTFWVKTSKATRLPGCASPPLPSILEVTSTSKLTVWQNICNYQITFCLWYWLCECTILLLYICTANALSHYREKRSLISFWIRFISNRVLQFFIITGFACCILLAQGCSDRFVQLSISVGWILLQLHILACTQLWV